MATKTLAEQKGPGYNALLISLSNQHGTPFPRRIRNSCSQTFAPETTPKILDGSKKLLERIDKSFGSPLELSEIRRTAGNMIDEEYSIVNETHSRTKDVIRDVQLIVNNYYKSLGVALASVRIVFRDRDGKPILTPDERDSPTLGVIPQRFEPRNPSEAKSTNRNKVVGFRITEGGEEITVLSDVLFARGFLPGEAENGLLWRHQNITPLFVHSHPIIVPKSSVIAVAVPFADTPKLNAQGILSGSLRNIRGQKRKVGGVYFCRYLTNEAVRKALGLEEEKQERKPRGGRGRK